MTAEIEEIFDKIRILLAAVEPRNDRGIG